MPGGLGFFTSSFAARESGLYRVEVASEAHGRPLETALRAAPPLLEKQDQPVNDKILGQISAVSHGASFSTGTFDNAVKQISLLPELAAAPKRIRAWSDPRWGAILLILLTVSLASGCRIRLKAVELKRPPK